MRLSCKISATAGYVPPITADQILAFYAQVEGWISRAQQAHANPDYRLDVAVPAAMPPWSEVEPCPNTHLHGMLEAMRSVRDHAQAALLFLPDLESLSDPKQAAQGNQIRQLLAAASSKARYAEDLHGASPTQEVHERAEPFVKDAIAGFYRLGQWLAMPQLAEPIFAEPIFAEPIFAEPIFAEPIPAEPISTEVIAERPAPERPALLPALPGEDGFDPWCLTDSVARARFKADAQARRAIKELWRLDPDPARTLAIQQEIDDARQRGDVKEATDRQGTPLGYFFCCPWATVYVVRRPVTLGGRRLQTMQEFVFDVTAEGTSLGEPFKRQIKTGAFQSTEEYEYGDPNAPPDH